MGNQVTLVENHVYPSGNTYSGEMKGGKRHGDGVYTWTEDGCTYDGMWLNNLQNGRGKMTFKNGNVYVGNFTKNNIDGEGFLSTRFGEKIKGYFRFKQRMLTTDGPRYPVAEYDLSVDVTSKTGVTQRYEGPATLHIYTGMLVLPGMQSPDIPIYDAVFVVDPVNSNKSQFAVVENENVAAAECVSVAQPVVQANQGLNTGVAYGAEDESYQKEVKLKTAPINPFDPRNYF